MLPKSNYGLEATHKYRNYKDYVNHQTEKTTDPERVKKWLNDEWESKVVGFKEIFIRNQIYVHGKQRALCLGSRTGQEVKALLDMGITAIGIDLIPFPPYTIEGDIHGLVFKNNEFDLVFTNIFDHSLFPEKFCLEMERVCKPAGIIIIHLLLGPNKDEYTETVVSNPEKVVALFKSIEIKESREIKNSIDMLNWELVLEKSKCAHA
jgi:SAM-dependent methyltransferase